MSFLKRVNQAKGWIALDIDGTLTHDCHELPKKVVQYLEQLHDENWNIIFATGRMFSYGLSSLKNINFPYFYIPQNGSSWYLMPERKLGGKKYLKRDLFLKLLYHLEDSDLDLFLFAGIENQDQVFYREKKLNQEILQYVEKTLSKLSGTWKNIDSFSSLNIDEFAYGKIYGTLAELEPIYQILEKVPSIKVHLVKDSVNPKYHIIQIMDKFVDKGTTVLELIGQTVLPRPIICAGNDLNDVSLLDIADIKIAMEGSPKELLDQATIIAPLENLGILAAIQLGIEKVKDL